MAGCYIESYELSEKKRDFDNNKIYLKSKTCCDAKSCDDLAYEYEKLGNKCNEVYGEIGAVGIINNKGRVDSPICDNIKQKQDEYYDKARRMFGGKTKKRNKRIRNKRRSNRRRKSIKKSRRY